MESTLQTPDDAAAIVFETQWSLWADCKVNVTPNHVQSKEEFESSLHLVASIENARDLWSWLQHMPAASNLPPNANIYLMRQGIMPMWEHEANTNGGHITLRCDKHHSDSLWQLLVLMAVGEEMENCLLGGERRNDAICGVAICARNTSNVLQIWNRSTIKFNPQSFCKSLEHTIAPSNGPSGYPYSTYRKVLSNPIYKSHKGT